MFLLYSFTHSMFPSLSFPETLEVPDTASPEPFECKLDMFLAILHCSFWSLSVLHLLNQWPFIYLTFNSKISSYFPDILFVCIWGFGCFFAVVFKIPFCSTSERSEFKYVFSIYHFNLEPQLLLLLVIHFSLRLAEKFKMIYVAFHIFIYEKRK